MQKKFVSGATPLDYSPHGAPRQAQRPSAADVFRRAAQARLEKRHKGRPRTKQDEQFERRKYPGVFD